MSADSKKPPRSPDAFEISKKYSRVLFSMGTKEAMQSILNEIHEDDHFTITEFESSNVYWREQLTRATKQSVSEAINYVKSIRAQGGTNINGAVLSAVHTLKKGREEKTFPERSVDMIILLTDGMPNVGTKNIWEIQENVRTAIGGKMSLFCLGFGNYVEYSFLDVMSRENKGIARRIFTGSDAAIQLKGFYEEVSSPLLSEVEMRYPDNAVSSLTETQYSRLFNGSEIVVAGRLNDSFMDNFLVEVSGQGAEGEIHERGKAGVLSWDMVYPEEEYIFGDFTERLWAYLTIQQQLEKSGIASEQEKDQALAKALSMSLRYNFVTPLTSMVVTKPETEKTFIADKLTEDQRQNVELGRNPPDLNQRKPASNRVQGNAGNPPDLNQRKPASNRVQGNVDGDPHFMIELPDRGDALCFNINDKPGTIYNLVKDKKSGFFMNGQIIGKKKFSADAKNNTYFGRFSVNHQKLGVKLDVSIDDILVFNNGKQIRLKWSDAASIKEASLVLRLTNNCTLTVMLQHSVKFMIIKHTKIWKKHHFQQDYLGFYTLDSHHLSSTVHGLIGQFYHGVEFELTDLYPGEFGERLDAVMYIKGQTLNVTRHLEKDFSRDVKIGKDVLCWFVDDNGKGFIDGSPSDYIVPNLFNF